MTQQMSTTEQNELIAARTAKYAELIASRTAYVANELAKHVATIVSLGFESDAITRLETALAVERSAQHLLSEPEAYVLRDEILGLLRSTHAITLVAIAEMRKAQSFANAFAVDTSSSTRDARDAAEDLAEWEYEQERSGRFDIPDTLSGREAAAVYGYDYEEDAIDDADEYVAQHDAEEAEALQIPDEWDAQEEDSDEIPF